MRSLIFMFTLVLYGYSAMDLQGWVRVPQVVLHLLEHHSDFGHHDKQVNGHDEHEGDHDPFSNDGHDQFCSSNGTLALLPGKYAYCLSVAPLTGTLGTTRSVFPESAFSGTVGNPPKA